MRKTTLLILFCLLTITEGIITIEMLFSIPRETKNAMIFGLSPERIILLALIAFFPICSGIILTYLIINQSKRSAILVIIDRFLSSSKVLLKANIAFLLILIAGLEFIMLTPEIAEPFTHSYFVRLRPLVLLITTFSAQSLLFLSLFTGRLLKTKTSQQAQSFRCAAIVITIFIAIWGLVAYTRLGLNSSDVGIGWNALGNPILGWQVLLAWIITSSGLGLAIRLRQKFTPRTKKFPAADFILSITLWIVAFVLWMSVPLAPSWFASAPRPPNFSYYPNSDASVYDTTSQSALVGEGFQSWGVPFAIRPMYALILAIFHKFGGLDYEPIIWMQVAFIAFLPVGIYWLTKRIHNRISGILVALLIIFRETNAIQLGDVITNSHAKLLMSDLPTTVGVILFLLLIIIWLQEPQKYKKVPLIAGGVMGMFMLIRPEFGVLLPVIGLISLIRLRKWVKQWFKSMVFLIIGLCLMLSPWIWRNYQITGTIFLDSPSYRADLFAQRYRNIENQNQNKETPIATTPIPTTESKPLSTDTLHESELTPISTPTIEKHPGESIKQFTQRLMQDVTVFIKKNPGAVLNFTLNHYMNSEIQTVLYLPATNQFFDSMIGFLGHRDINQFFFECCSPKHYISKLPFWHKWNGTLPLQSYVPIILNLMLISIGLSTAWVRQKWIGILPLMSSFGHYGINALVRNSGGRYILAMDWIGALYFGIGMTQITIWVIQYFRNKEIQREIIGETPYQPISYHSPLKFFTKANVLTAFIIILVGCSLPIADQLIPERYPDILLDKRLNELPNEINTVLSSDEVNIVNNFIHQGGSAFLGRALYPRFHRSGQGESGSTWQAFYPRPFPRISFYLVGQKNTGVILPHQKKPDYFPNGADVLIIGCPRPDYFDTLAIIVYDSDGNSRSVYLREPLEENFACIP